MSTGELFDTDTMNSEAYSEISSRAIKILKDALKTEVALTREFYEKDSYGDVDILILKRDSSWTLDLIVKDILADYVDSFFAYNVNGEVASLGFMYDYGTSKYQIDIILIEPEDWDIAQVYYSFSILGNLVGKLYKDFKNISFTPKGLRYKYYNESEKIAEFIFTKNPEKIIRFIGLDYTTYIKGFSTEVELFEYIIGSDHFHKQFFELDSVNNKTRKRDNRNKTYKKFEEYLKDIPSIPYIQLNEDEAIKLIVSYFGPDMSLRLNKAFKRYLDTIKYRRKFNGDIVSKITGFKEKTLGDFMKKFEVWMMQRYFIADVGHSDFKEFVLKTSPANIKKYIQSFHLKGYK